MQVGEQQINLCLGDCLTKMKTLKDKSVDLIVTDPPYDISATNGGVQ